MLFIVTLQNEIMLAPKIKVGDPVSCLGRASVVTVPKCNAPRECSARFYSVIAECSTLSGGSTNAVQLSCLRDQTERSRSKRKNRFAAFPRAGLDITAKIKAGINALIIALTIDDLICPVRRRFS